MIAERIVKSTTGSVWSALPLMPPRRWQQERLERCRPMAAAVSELLAVATEEETSDPFSPDGFSAPFESDQPSCLDECVGTEDPELAQVEDRIAWHQLVEGYSLSTATVMNLG